jgi:hypothetical protein
MAQLSRARKSMRTAIDSAQECKPVHNHLLSVRAICVALTAWLATLAATPAIAAEIFDIGLATSGAHIDALAVPARSGSLPKA